MKKIIYILIALFFVQAHAQNPAKGFKALDDKQYLEAEKIFSDLLVLDEKDVAANFGMSKIYSAPASGKKDLEKSFEHFNKADEGFKSADSKTKEKYTALGVTVLALTEQRSNIERAFLEDAKKKNTIEAFDEFINRFPSSTVNASAQNSRNAIAYIKAQAINTVEAWAEFCDKYPQANEISDAKKRRNELATQVALSTNSVDGYKEFLRKYSDAPQVPQIQQRLNAVAFDQAKATNTVEIWEAYVREYPSSIFLNQAKQQLEYLRAGVDGE